MVDFGGDGSGRDRWTCPNDRQLALRAKLRTGWSVKTQTYQTYTAKNEGLDDEERAIILDVIKRAENLEVTEQLRVGKLVQRLESIKRNAIGNGKNKCVLCGDSFGILGATGSSCKDCKKVSCQKCGISVAAPGSTKEIWLCKICAETREIWKKSGAWFFKGFPKYVLPEPKTSKQTYVSTFATRSPLRFQKQGNSTSEAEESSSDDDDNNPMTGKKYKLQNIITSKGSIGSCSSEIPSTTATATVNPLQRSIDLESDRSSNSGSLKGVLRRESSVDREHNPSVRWADCDSVSDGVNGGQIQLVPSQASFVRRDSSLSGGSSSTSAWGDSKDEIPEEVYLGSMEFSITYESKSSTLHCCLHRAKGLRPMDINGLTDAYCRAQLLPADSAKACAPLRTKTVHKSRDPEFNETLAWCHVTETDQARKTLHLVIFDEDKYGHEALGSARLHLSRLTPALTSHFNVYLEKPYQDEISIEECNPGRGSILVSLCYATRRRALIVGIMRCLDLIPMDSNGTSDPFAKIQLRGDPHRRKFKTSIKWRNLNPEFNEEFTLDIKLGELSRRTLLITVWDKDLGKANDYLGGLELGFSSKGDRLKHWLDAIKFPDRRHERWHNLTDQTITD